ncbi:unnamed protein product, partial [Natator depressus]
MDCLGRRCGDAATFDFWTDYLGLCALVGWARPGPAARRALPRPAPAPAPAPAPPLRPLRARPRRRPAPAPCARCAPVPAAALPLRPAPAARPAPPLRPAPAAHPAPPRPAPAPCARCAPGAALCPAAPLPARRRRGASEGGCAGGPGPFELPGAERKGRKMAPGGGHAKPEPEVCVCCRKKGAPQGAFGSHRLKGLDGRVLCPALRACTCPLCRARGDNAHTRKYWPLSRQPPPAPPLPAPRGPPAPSLPAP